MERYSSETMQIIKKAEELGIRSGGLVGTEHMLAAMAMVEGTDVEKILKDNGFDAQSAAKIVGAPQNGTKAVMSPRLKEVFEFAHGLVRANNFSIVTPEFILFAILQDTSSYAVRALKSLGCNINKMIEDIKNSIMHNGAGEEEYDDYSKEDNNDSQNRESRSEKGGTSNIKELDKLGVDLTSKAEKNMLDPVIGRKDEIDRIIQILSRRTKNNPVLIGEAGVGKSAIVEGLAQAIVSGNVPEMLKGKRVFSLDMSSVIAGTKYRGEFEERLQNAIAAIKKAGNIIIFIDEIHTIVGAGGAEGAVDAANILKPMLARGELQTIGATTIDEYRKHIEKDPALERRFQPIMVNPPSVEDTIIILKGIRDKYEAHHKVTISDEAIEAAAKLSDRYITDRYLPDKAIDLIDEAASKKRVASYVMPKNVQIKEDELVKITQEMNDCAKRQNYQKAAELKDRKIALEKEIESAKNEWKEQKIAVELKIGETEIAEIVSSWTGIPVVKLTESEADRLMHLEDVLHKRVIGQQEAIVSVSKAVRRARAGLKDPNRPIGSFIFLGPTGVGKTELSKALAEAMFGDENLMIRVDMSEYMEKINVSRLVGSAPGYVGFEEGGQLTEQVRRHPYSVVLFDEIEKAHPDVFNILLQILEDGRLTDSHGRVVSFKNTIIIMTSNIGAGEIGKMSKLGFNSETKEQDYERMKERQLDALKKTMRPEFINRIDDIIIFHKLEKDDLRQIVKLMINGLVKRLNEQNIKLEVTVEAEDYIVEKGYDSEYGARPLRRSVQKLLEDKLSEEILLGKVEFGESVKVSVIDDALTFEKIV